jgi:hypothetical protein
MELIVSLISSRQPDFLFGKASFNSSLIRFFAENLAFDVLCENMKIPSQYNPPSLPLAALRGRDILGPLAVPNPLLSR